ncbi:MAG: hypothetical protein ASARMPREDX12_007849 [Alectoria sarmentosa]|nr:MAG: hypothetical protein ASARMPREDX12_007849 [Alectoria sarmentosa]
MEEKEKETLFDELYQLDEDDSGEEDQSGVSVILRQSRLALALPRSKFSARAPTPLPQPSVSNHRQANVVETSAFSSTASSKPSEQIVIDTPIMPKKTAGLTAQKEAPKTTRKRKRGQSLELKPESQQIFNGLAFYFIPNNDTSIPRKLRIRKAMEWGALWIREWRDGVTHIIVDNDLSYDDVLKALKISSLPSDIKLVNERYPADCIMYRFVVDEIQPLYRVAGHDDALMVQHSPTPALSSGTSLQLKPEQREHLPPQQTPSRTEGSELTSSSRVPVDAGFAKEPSPQRSTMPPHAYPQNDLDKAIAEAQATKDLPLDLDEEDYSKDSVLDDSENEHSEEEKSRKTKQKKGSFNKSWQDTFSCMSKHDGAGKSANSNARTIEVLQQMADYYERDQDHWRLTAYRRAIAALRKQDRKITTEEEAFAIPFVGQRLAAKIEEIVWTNKLRRLENTNLDSNAEVLQLFMAIYGVGLKQATKWVDQGHKSIPELLEKAHLTKNQKIGIAHYEDFKTRIPRAEMDRHDQYVRETCSKIDNTIQFTIGGSYRRGAADSGDVDFIVTKPDATIDTLRTIVLDRIIPKLFDKDYLKVGLATTDKVDGSKWHGAAGLPGTTVWRRIDFLLVPWDEIGAALIYFTGNDIFNRSMRLLASKKGMRLNQRGLWNDVMRGRNRERITQGDLVEGRDEKKIFELLGVPWRPPHHRIC